MTPGRWLAVGLAALLGLVGFLLFRPDTLFTEVRADESLDEAFTATTIGEVASTSSSAGTATNLTSVTVAEEVTTTTSGPVQVTTGEFYGIDHSAEGTASILEQDGRYVLRFEDNTNIQNGPDLYVWVLPSTDYQGGNPDARIDLGSLKGTVGGQNYELPPDFDPAVHRAVLIWCLRFAVPFAAAPLG
jgi:hypothetical protein